MSGTNQLVKVTLRNPLDHSDLLTYEITTFDTPISAAWYSALKQILSNDDHLEKNFCFLGFPNTARDLNFLCNELNSAIATINNCFDDYLIEEIFTPETCVAVNHKENKLNHKLFNTLHTHFEQLQGTVENLSTYYKRADYETKYAIRQLNNLCHEMESLILSLIKASTIPEWVRPSQITTFLQCQRYQLTDDHRTSSTNGYDRHFGRVYMHWSQIGKTLFEVFRDEGAPMLTDTQCGTINSLQYYSGEFDIEWGNSIYVGGPFPWHNTEQAEFKKWLHENNIDATDARLCLGHLPVGEVDYYKSFNSEDPIVVREIVGKYLDIYSIEVDGIKKTYEYSWTDSDYKQQQIDMMRLGYDFSSRG